MRRIFPVMLIIAVLLGGCFFYDMPRNPVWDYNYSEMDLVQLQPPHEGQPMITVHTAYGEITAMLFPEHAPNTVANFIERIEDGFYENKPVVALIKGEILFTGAYDEEGHQGMTNDGKLIENEYSVDLWPFKGSMLAFSGRQGFGDSRFWLIGGVPLSDENADAMRNTVRSDETKLFPEELITALDEHESLPGAMGMYTIFGHMTGGFDVLDKLLSLPTEEESSRPLDEILIEKIVLWEYSEN